MLAWLSELLLWLEASKSQKILLRSLEFPLQQQLKQLGYKLELLPRERIFTCCREEGENKIRALLHRLRLGLKAPTLWIKGTLSLPGRDLLQQQPSYPRLFEFAV
jgi:hypothetical protein